MREKCVSANNICDWEDCSLLAKMHSSIRESKNSLFSYGNEAAANHRVSLYVAGVCACLLLFITIVLVSIPGNLYSTNPPAACNCTTNPPQQAAGCKHANPPHAKPALKSTPQCTIVVESNNDCQVTCADVGVSEAGELPGQVAATHIAIFYQNNSVACSDWSLLIKSSKFPNNQVDIDWFKVDDEKSFPPIKSLELQKCFGLKMIEEGALEKFPFGRNLKSFTLARNMAFIEINTNSFKGLLSLQQLNLRGNGIITVVRGNIFEQFQSSLQVLQVQGGFADSTLMAQMTGTCQENILNRLEIVELSYGSQGKGMQILDSRQFSALTKVRSLYLRQSGISIIHGNAFDTISDSILMLNLADNQLRTLENGTFEKIIKRKTKIELYLKGNEWTCDCKLKWFQELLLDNNSVIELGDTPICVYPESELGKSLQTANMSSTCPETVQPPKAWIKCPSDMPTPTTTTTTLQPPSTTTPPEIHCNAFHPSLRHKSIAGKSLRFNVIEDALSEQEYAEVVVDTGEGVGRTLVWHRDDQPSCLRGVSGPVVVKNLTRGVAYVFCLYEGDDIESPSQCRGVKTLPAWEARAWIANEKMSMWVALFVIIAIVCALVGAASVIFAFWQKPTLLALSSRVVKVRTSRHEAVVMPKRPKGVEKIDLSQEQEADCTSIRSDPSYVSVHKVSKVSLFAFRFRAWLRKVENGEISVHQPPGVGLNFGNRGQQSEPSVPTVSCSHL